MVRPASKFLTEEQKKNVEEAVTAAEKKTSGEIVVVLATKSGRYDRGEDLFGLVVACIVVTVGWIFLQSTGYKGEGWTAGGFGVTLGLLPVLGLFIGGFALGAFVATMFPQIGRLFLTKGHQLEEVKQKATEAFFKFRVRKTGAGTGILIYVSLFEHLVWVVGDDALNEKIDQAAWEGIRDKIIDGFKKGDPSGGLRAGVERCGEILSEHFPIKEGDVDELTNEVRFVD